MTGQLDAQWYCHLLGIGSYVPSDKERKVLRQVWDHNYSEEGGLINASYPEGRIPTLYTYENVQVESNWSGIEYAMVSMYLENGYLKEAGELAANIDGRYMQAGRIFNHENVEAITTVPWRHGPSCSLWPVCGWMCRGTGGRCGPAVRKSKFPGLRRRVMEFSGQTKRA